ncbi:MAG: curli production assembly/transport protein CsgE [Pyrinomonadaceae bacterium]|nr:curli production assembly/transport protein CsgE [Pyrinomonadaceae bacterium]
MISQTSSLARLAETDSGISESYRHITKSVKPGESLELSEAVIKWYEVYPQDLPLPDEIRQLARACLTKTPLEFPGLGFVLLHRCGQDFYFLIACTWRNNNEILETVFYKDGVAMSEFAPFPREGSHKPAFCVWELVPVWHEQQAWVRFLNSPRDEAAAQMWVRDQYEGDA